MKPVYIVNYHIAHNSRTANFKAFDLLSDAKQFLKDKYGYIVRSAEENEIVFMSDNFNPSAQEQLRIKTITGKDYVYRQPRVFACKHSLKGL